MADVAEMGAIKLSCVSFGNANLQKILPLVHFSMTKAIVNVASQCVYLYLKDLHVQKGVCVYIYIMFAVLAEKRRSFE